MCPSSSTEERCEYPGGRGFDVNSGLDEQRCLREEGRVVPRGDAGSAGPRSAPLTTYLFDAHLGVPLWQDAAQVDGWSNARTAERLVLHPLCTLRRRAPEAELLAGLQALNEEFADQLVEVLRPDADLRRATVELVLEISSIAASALDADDGNEGEALPVSDELLERARRVVEAIQQVSTDERLRDACARLLEQGQQLVGTPVASLTEVLRGTQRWTSREA